MNFTPNELLSAAVRTFEKLDAGTRFIVQDLIPPAIWRELPLTPDRGHLGLDFAREMEKLPYVHPVGKTQDGQMEYVKTDRPGENSAGGSMA